MTTTELYKDLTDAEFKVYSFIKMWQDGRKTFTPDAEYIAENVGKDKRSVFRAMAGLKDKGLL